MNTTTAASYAESMLYHVRETYRQAVIAGIVPQPLSKAELEDNTTIAALSVLKRDSTYRALVSLEAAS